jgi:hypothetical protein
LPAILSLALAARVLNIFNPVTGSICIGLVDIGLFNIGLFNIGLFNIGSVILQHLPLH